MHVRSFSCNEKKEWALNKTVANQITLVIWHITNPDHANCGSGTN